MTMFFKKVQNKAENSAAYNKWYGRAVITNEVGTKELADEISHSTTVTYADVMAVLIELQTSMKRHLQNSEKVHLEGLGALRVGLMTKAADTRDAFKPTNVKGYRVIFEPETHFVPNGQLSDKGKRKGTYVKSLLEGITVREFSSAKKAAKADDAADSNADGNAGSQDGSQAGA